MSSFARAMTVIGLVTTIGCGSSEPGGTTGAGGTGGAAGTAAGRGGTGGIRPEDGGGSGGAPGDTDAAPPDGDNCQATAASHPIEGAQHVAVCSPVTYGTNPPSSGNHYPIWADYRTYERPIPRGFWVHSLEHGAVVITYNCPEGCAAEVADAQTFIDGLPADCGASARRVILAPDPELDVRFAASAWGFTLRANCFDRESFSSFYSEHYDHAPESICGGGTDPSDLCGASVR